MRATQVTSPNDRSLVSTMPPSELRVTEDVFPSTVSAIPFFDFSRISPAWSPPLLKLIENSERSNHY